MIAARDKRVKRRDSRIPFLLTVLTVHCVSNMTATITYLSTKLTMTLSDKLMRSHLFHENRTFFWSSPREHKSPSKMTIVKEANRKEDTMRLRYTQSPSTLRITTQTPQRSVYFGPFVWAVWVKRFPASNGDAEWMETDEWWLDFIYSISKWKHFCVSCCIREFVFLCPDWNAQISAGRVKLFTLGSK